MDNNKEVLVDRSLAKTTATAEDGTKDFLSSHIKEWLTENNRRKTQR